MTGSLSKLSDKAAVLWIVAAILLVYANSLGNFFALDDYPGIVQNDFIKSWDNFPGIFKKSYLTDIADFSDNFYELASKTKGSGELSYRPLITASYFLDYSLWKLNPFGYHLTNLLLHMLNCLLLYFFLKALLNNARLALFASLLFALHPVNSETVSAIGFREDLMAFCFYLAAFILYIRYIRADRSAAAKKALYYLLSVFSFLLALFSKEMAMTLPVLLIIYDYLFIFNAQAKVLFKKAWLRYTGYIAVLGFYAWVRFFVFNVINPLAVSTNLYAALNKMADALLVYLKDIFLPFGIYTHLSFTRRMPLDSLSLQAVAVLACLAFILFVAVRIRRTQASMAFCILWFFACLLPVSNIYPLCQPIASRFLYIPLVGFCVFLALLLAKFKKQWLAERIFIAILAVYAVFTAAGNLTWKNNIALWSDIAEHNPDNYTAHWGLAAAYLSENALDEAIREYKTALKLKPCAYVAHNSLGACYYYKSGPMLDEAIREFKEAIALSPGDYAAPYYNLGLAYQLKRNWAEAEKMFEQVSRIDPGYRDIRKRLEALRQR